MARSDQAVLATRDSDDAAHVGDRGSGSVPMTANLMGHSPMGSHYPAQPTHESTARSARVPTHVQDAYGKHPLAFEANRGQTDPRVKFCARGSGYVLFLTPTRAVLSLRRPGTTPDQMAAPGDLSADAVTAAAPAETAVAIRLLGANPTSQMSARTQLPGRSNYFIGNDPSRWITDVPTYDAVCYRDVYPGIVLVYYGSQDRLEYDFVLAPGVNPPAIALRFEGASDLAITPTGDLFIETPCRRGRPAPTLRLSSGPKRTHEVDGKYVCADGDQVSVKVGSYDPSRPLIIDPLLRYSTHLGAAGEDAGYGIAVDEEGNSYITGRTRSVNFPTTACPASKQGKPSQ